MADDLVKFVSRGGYPVSRGARSDEASCGFKADPGGEEPVRQIRYQVGHRLVARANARRAVRVIILAGGRAWQEPA